jgi:hypothetical protein
LPTGTPDSDDSLLTMGHPNNALTSRIVARLAYLDTYRS